MIMKVIQRSERTLGIWK